MLKKAKNAKIYAEKFISFRKFALYLSRELKQITTYFYKQIKLIDFLNILS